MRVARVVWRRGRRDSWPNVLGERSGGRGRRPWNGGRLRLGPTVASKKSNKDERYNVPYQLRPGLGASVVRLTRRRPPSGRKIAQAAKQSLFVPTLVRMFERASLTGADVKHTVGRGRRKAGRRPVHAALCWGCSGKAVMSAFPPACSVPPTCKVAR
jgi:hypothetical protein